MRFRNVTLFEIRRRIRKDYFIIFSASFEVGGFFSKKYFIHISFRNPSFPIGHFQIARDFIVSNINRLIRQKTHSVILPLVLKLKIKKN